MSHLRWWRAMTCVIGLTAPAADAGLGPEQPLTQPTREPTPAADPALTFDGTDYLAAWLDVRVSPTGASPQGIRVAHFTPAGQTLEARPVLLGVDNGADLPDVAAGATGALVVYPSSNQLLYVRLGADGGLLDDGGVALPGAVTDTHLFSVAGAGDVFTIAWDTQQSVIGATRVNLQGVADPQPQVLATTGIHPVLGTDGRQFLLVWVDFFTRELFAAPLDPTAPLPDAGAPLGLFTTFPLVPPALAFDGSRYLVTYGSSSGLVFATLAADGGVLTAPAPLPGGTAPGATFDGQNFVVVTSTPGGSPPMPATMELITRLSSSLQVLDSAPVWVGAGQPVYAHNAIASDGTRSAVPTWNNDPSQGTFALFARIFDSRVDPTSGVTVPLAAEPPTQRNAVAIPVDGGWRVAWTGDHRGLANVSVMELPAANEMSAGGHSDERPALVGDWFFTAQSSGVVARSATSLGSSGFTIGGATHPSASSTTREHVLVMLDAAGRVVANHFPVGTDPLVPVNLLVDGHADAGAPAVGCGDSDCVVIWSRRNDDGGFELDGTVVGETSTWSSPTGAFVLAQTGAEEPSLAVAGTGTSYLAVWSQGLADGGAIVARFLDGASLQPPFTVAAAATRLGDPQVASVGSSWLVVWDTAPSGDSDVEAAWLSTVDGGTSITPVEIAATAEDERLPWVTSSELGSVLVLYQRYSAQTDGWRLFYQQQLRFGLGASCATSDDCNSGFCTDGVCCSSACLQACAACSIAHGGDRDGTCTPSQRLTLCRPAVSACDAVESCDGQHLDCPSDQSLADLTPCDDGDPATHGDRCLSGVCKGDPASVCAPGVDCGHPGPQKKKCGCDGAGAGLPALFASAWLFRRRRGGSVTAARRPVPGSPG